MQASEINYQPLTTIRLHGQLRQFGESFRLAVKSPAEAIKALCVQIPGFERFLSNAKSRGLEFAVFRDKRNIGEKELTYNGAGDIRIAPSGGGQQARRHSSNDCRCNTNCGRGDLLGHAFWHTAHRCGYRACRWRSDPNAQPPSWRTQDQRRAREHTGLRLR